MMVGEETWILWSHHALVRAPRQMSEAWSPG